MLHVHKFSSGEDTEMAVCALAVILMLFAVSEGQYDSFYYSKESYPNPMKEPAICGRNHVRKSYVCDPNHILGSQDTEGMCVCSWNFIWHLLGISQRASFLNFLVLSAYLMVLYCGLNEVAPIY